MNVRLRPTAVLVMSVLVFVAACTDSVPSAEVSTTTGSTIATTSQPTFDLTNFSMGQIVNSPPLDWSVALSDTELEPADLLSVGGVTYALASDAGGRGLRGWSSVDGETWADMGDIFPPDLDLAVATTDDDQLVLVTEGRAGLAPQVWTSFDGTDWHTEDIPIDAENPLLAFSPAAVTTTGTLTIVAGETWIDAESVLAPSIEAALWPGYDVDRYGLEWGTTADDIEIDVLGPTGLTLMTATSAELGLAAQTEEWLRTEPTDEFVTVWIGLGGAEWSSSTVDGAISISSLAATSRGAIVATGLTELEQVALWVTFDGFLWEQIPFSARPYEVVSWDEFLVGPVEAGGFDLVVSGDGLVWESTGLDNHFPRSQQWFVDALGASPAGVSVTGQLFDFGSGQGGGFEITPIQEGDVEVYVDAFSTGLLAFDGEVGYEWGLGKAKDETLGFDPSTETVRLLRPDGSELASLTLAELDKAADERRIATYQDSRHYRALSFSEDGDSWAIWDLAPIGDRSQPTHLRVTASTMVIAATDHLTGTGFELWTASIP